MRRSNPDEHATARPLQESELEVTFCRDGGGGTRKRSPRPDADAFSLPVDGDEDPPLAALFDSYGEDE